MQQLSHLLVACTSRHKKVPCPISVKFIAIVCQKNAAPKGSKACPNYIPSNPMLFKHLYVKVSTRKL